MHKILKKTIKYTACGIGVLLLAIILFVSILYFSADMLTPDYTPKANGELVQTDSLREYAGNYLRQSNSGLWELKVSGDAFQRGEAIGKLSSDLLYYQEKVFVDQIREIVPSDNYLKFLRFFIVLFNRNLGKNVPEEFRDEIYGISLSCTHEYDFIGTPYERQLNYHSAHDLGHAMQDYMLVGCSSFATWGENSADSSLIIGRNFDFYMGDKFAHNKLVSFYQPEQGYKFASVGWPGMIGVLSGMNETGLTVTINAAKSDMPTASATPISILTREILETQLYMELVQALSEFIPAIQVNANQIARLDCLLSFANVARENNYIRPVIEDNDVLDIRQGRHPVIEKQLPIGEKYIANDVVLDSSSQQIIIITGPNMAGKSALLRQTALITLLAQIGSFVPAESAHIGLVDKIFTRVGASDNISVGESTFMVEMNEAADILNNLSSRSLVLFDELGRGTSTYDGISIAWAIVEHIHEHPKAKARTLFATHYHELNEMEKSFKRIKNYNVSVKEVDNKVIFLRKLERGGSEHSFGIHVAKMAGMPKSIVKRANDILKQLEADNRQQGIASKPMAEVGETRGGMQLSFFQLEDPVLCQIRDEILNLDVNNLTPLEALNKLNDIKRIVKGK